MNKVNIRKLKIIIASIAMTFVLGCISVSAASWELGYKIPALSTSYAWDSTISWDTSMKTAWNNARSAWKTSNGVTYYYMSNSGYKQGCMKKLLLVYMDKFYIQIIFGEIC